MKDGSDQHDRIRVATQLSDHVMQGEGLQKLLIHSQQYTQFLCQFICQFDGLGLGFELGHEFFVGIILVMAHEFDHLIN